MTGCRVMKRQRLGLRIGSCCAVFVAGLVAAFASPVERGASQTPASTSTEVGPAPAPDPVPDPNPSLPPSGGSGGDSSGSSGGSGSVSPSPSSDGTVSPTDATESTAASTALGEAETKPGPTRQKKQADKPAVQAVAAHKPRDPASRSAGQAGNLAGLGVAAKSKAPTLAHVELFILGLAGALALALMVLAAIPQHVLTGVSVALAERRREVEIVIAAVLWSLVIGLFVARCAAPVG
jgi:hypothetical protein